MKEIALVQMLPSWTSSALIAGFVLAALFFLRGHLTNFFISVFGDRNVDDLDIVKFKNRDSIIKNTKAAINLSAFGQMVQLFAIPTIIIGTLIHPFVVFAGIIAYFSVGFAHKQRVVEDFELFADSNNDEFLRFFNQKYQKINMLYRDAMFASYVFLLAGIITRYPLLYNLGMFFGVCLLFVSFASLAIAHNYIRLHRYVDYYRSMRILATSTVGNAKGTIVFSILGIAAWTHEEFFAGGLIIALGKLIVSRMFKSALERTQAETIEAEAIEYREYDNLSLLGSFPNPKAAGRGYLAATALEAKLHSLETKQKAAAKGEKLVHLSNFAFYQDSIAKSALARNPLTRESLTGIEMYIEPKNFLKQVLFFGSVGSGKTNTLNHLIKQVIDSNFTIFGNLVINDSKQTFKRDFFQPGRDIFLNMFDKDGTAWHLFKEMEQNPLIGTAFVGNLVAQVTKEQDFWANEAKRYVSNALDTAFLRARRENDIDLAWGYFKDEIDAGKQEAFDVDDDTKKSIYAVLESAVQTISDMAAHCARAEHSFSIYDFIKGTGKILFVANQASLSTRLGPYITGFWGAYATAIMDLQDVSEKDRIGSKITLNIFDEYRTLKFTPETNNTFATEVRSKNIGNIFVLHHTEAKDVELAQKLQSSVYMMMLFRPADPKTQGGVLEKLGRVEHLQLSMGAPQKDNMNLQSAGESGIGGELLSAMLLSSFLKSRNNKDRLSYSMGQSEVMTAYQLETLPEFHHLVIIPEESTKVLQAHEREQLFKLLVFGKDDVLEEVLQDGHKNFLPIHGGLVYVGCSPLAKIEATSGGFNMIPVENILFKKELPKEKTLEELEKENKAVIAQIKELKKDKTMAEEMEIDDELLVEEVVDLIVDNDTDENKIMAVALAYIAIAADSIENNIEPSDDDLIDPSTIDFVILNFEAINKQIQINTDIEDVVRQKAINLLFNIFSHDEDEA